MLLLAAAISGSPVLLRGVITTSFFTATTTAVAGVLLLPFVAFLLTSAGAAAHAWVLPGELGVGPLDDVERPTAADE